MIVARGRIRVDARRAIRKLRDHLLVDLHLYGCEIARVAVATGATWLDITWDTDDVIFTFDGRALPVAEVIRARDHVLSPDPDAANGVALRVLGIGVSAALGLRPRFVDVTVVTPEVTTRVRFEARHIDEDAEPAEPATKVVKVPARLAGHSGLQVHVRKKIDLPAVGRALRGDLPREVALLAEATRDAPLVVTLHGKPPLLEPEPVVLLRVDLEESSLRRGSLELLAAASHRGHTQFMDLGVRLAEGSALGIRESADLPLRIIVDSQRLPTNASRSQVQEESELVERVRLRVPATYEAALRLLGQVVETGQVPSPPRGFTFLDGRVRLLQRLAGSIAASAAIAQRQPGMALTTAERALLALPLLRDVMDRPLSLADVRGGTPDRPLHVYAGDQPLPVALAPWLTGMVWRRGEPAERALTVLTTHDADARIEEAKAGYIRRARALAHQPSPARLPRSADYFVRRTIDVKTGPYAGMVGEVGVHRRRTGAASAIRVLVDDRLLEQVPLPGTALPVDIVLSWPGHLLPRFAYDGVERNADLTTASVVALHAAALTVVEEHGANDPELARRATAALVATAQALDDDPAHRTALDALADLAIWPLTDGRLATLAELAAYVAKTGVLCTGLPGSGAAPDRRPVPLSSCMHDVLALLGGKTITIAYQPPDEEAVERGLRAAAEDAWSTVDLQRTDVRGFVGVGGPEERLLHGGKVRRRRPVTFRHGPVLIAFEDPTAIATPDGKTLLFTGVPDLVTSREEDLLLDAVVDRVRGGENAPRVGRDYLATALERLETKLRGRHTAARRAELTAQRERVAEAVKVLEQHVPLVFTKPPPRLDSFVPPAPPSLPRPAPAPAPAPPPVVVAPPLPPPDLRTALEQALRAIDITSRHVVRVEVTTSGRPVVYNARTKVVVLNVANASVQALANDPQQLLLLGVTAISEINRELAQVTDAEERRVVLDLLRST